MFLDEQSDESHWIPLADLMTGMMMVFLLIAILYMLKITAVASEYEASKSNLGSTLCAEFAKDLKRWGAQCDPKSLTIRFKSNDILFDTGKSQLKPDFILVLNDFFPRYIEVLNKYKDSIEEIRIEGHTSSQWSQSVSSEEAYILNMQLSQERTRSVLQYVLSFPNLQDKAWVKANLTANGLSSSKPIVNADGTENPAKSQRVEFRIKTASDKQLDVMMKALNAQ